MEKITGKNEKRLFSHQATLKPAAVIFSSQNLPNFADNWDVMAVEEKVKEILIAQLDVKPEQITPNARISEDLGADSLDTIELVMAFEEEYGIEIPDEKAERLRTVGDVIKYLTEM